MGLDTPATLFVGKSPQGFAKMSVNQRKGPKTKKKHHQAKSGNLKVAKGGSGNGRLKIQGPLGAEALAFRAQSSRQPTFAQRQGASTRAKVNFMKKPDEKKKKDMMNMDSDTEDEVAALDNTELSGVASDDGSEEAIVQEPVNRKKKGQPDADDLVLVCGKCNINGEQLECIMCKRNPLEVLWKKTINRGGQTYPSGNC